MTSLDLTMTSLEYSRINKILYNLNLERSFCISHNLMVGLVRILEKLFDKGFYDVIITI